MFKLNIECTKDISELHINFTDGTSAVVESGERTTDSTKSSTSSTTSTVKKESKGKRENRFDRYDRDYKVDPRESLYEYDENVPEVSKEIVKLPEIPEKNRDVKVASELQNLDF